MTSQSDVTWYKVKYQRWPVLQIFHIYFSAGDKWWLAPLIFPKTVREWSVLPSPGLSSSSEGEERAPGLQGQPLPLVCPGLGSVAHQQVSNFVIILELNILLPKLNHNFKIYYLYVQRKSRNSDENEIKWQFPTFQYDTLLTKYFMYMI